MNQKGRPRTDPAALKKILLIRLRRIGDIIMTTPAISALKESLPHASLSYVVERPYARLVLGNSSLDKIHIFDRARKFKGFLKLISQVRRERYDAVVDLHGGPRASLLSFVSRAKLKVGYKTKYRSFLYDITIPRKPGKDPIHSVENHLNLIRALGIDIAAPPPLFLPLPQKHEGEKVSQYFESNALQDAKVVTLHISAGNEFRNWGLENFFQISELLSQVPGVKVILVGTEEDLEAEQEILRRSRFPLLSLVGGLNLMELKTVISRSTLFIGPDSGPMHIAASTPTPIVALFGPTLPANFAPWKARAAILEKSLECRPCKQKKCLTGDFRCLRTITPQEVFEASERFLYDKSTQEMTKP